MKYGLPFLAALVIFIGENAMRYAVSSAEMKICDRNTSEYFGIDSAILMERAALEVCDVIDDFREKRNTKRRLSCLVLCGVGNNGGDGAAIARLLHQRGYSVSYCVIGDYTKCSELLLKQLHILEKYNLKADTFSNIRDNKSDVSWDIIVDAMFGIGLSRPVKGDYKAAVDYVNNAKALRKDELFVVSVDMPSGINADTGQLCEAAVIADTTVTFNQVKIGQLLYPGCEYTGHLEVRDVGITQDSFRLKEPGAFFYDEDVKELLPTRKKDSNKGSNGKVLIIAGSESISGACILSAKAALHLGAGMVRIFTAMQNAEVVKSLLPEALLDTYTEDDDITKKLSEALSWSTQAVLGPGLSTSAVAKKLVRFVLENYNKNLVIDADGLNIISEDNELRKLVANYSAGGKRLVLTPHLAEFSRLFGKSVKECKAGMLSFPKELADELHATVVCKDARTIVADDCNRKIYINVSGNDGMATAGSGDVLAGILGALASEKESSFEMACLGTYLHGICGDLAAKKLGRRAMVASDIIDALPLVLD